VTLILDTSAVVAYTHQSINIGEPISEVHDEGGQVLIPVVCLLEATRTADQHILGILVAHPAVTVEPLTGDQWPTLAHALSTLKRLDLTTALHAAYRVGGYVLTTEPQAYGDEGGSLIIEA
jgi:hypothetical protein